MKKIVIFAVIAVFAVSAYAQRMYVGDVTIADRQQQINFINGQIELREKAYKSQIAAINAEEKKELNKLTKNQANKKQSGEKSNGSTKAKKDEGYVDLGEDQPKEVVATDSDTATTTTPSVDPAPGASKAEIIKIIFEGKREAAEEDYNYDINLYKGQLATAMDNMVKMDKQEYVISNSWSVARKADAYSKIKTAEANAYATKKMADAYANGNNQAGTAPATSVGFEGVIHNINNYRNVNVTIKSTDGSYAKSVYLTKGQILKENLLPGIYEATFTTSNGKTLGVTKFNVNVTKVHSYMGNSVYWYAFCD